MQSPSGSLPLQTLCQLPPAPEDDSELRVTGCRPSGSGLTSENKLEGTRRGTEKNMPSGGTVAKKKTVCSVAQRENARTSVKGWTWRESKVAPSCLSQATGVVVVPRSDMGHQGQTELGEGSMLRRVLEGTLPRPVTAAGASTQAAPHPENSADHHPSPISPHHRRGCSQSLRGAPEGPVPRTHAGTPPAGSE